MKRYTKKIKNANNYCEYDLKYSPYTEIFDLTSNIQIEDYVNADLTLAIDKLGKLEDLEEQLGCPLEVFLKALDKGFYCPKNFGGREFILSSNDYQTQTFKNINDEWTISFIDNNVAVAGIHLKDYKKTWWLKKDKSE